MTGILRSIHAPMIFALLLLTAPAARGLEADAGASPGEAAAKPIARLWRGRTLASKADEYQVYLFASGIARIRETPGNLGVTVMRRADGKETEFLVISIWESIDAIRRFAGKDYEKAVILDRDREYLITVEPNVRHYEIEKTLIDAPPVTSPTRPTSGP
jgi:heme-degrading monooxygenase HmoA